jgi:predicted RNA-binding protein with PUA-like domain
VRLSERHLRQDPPSRAELDALRSSLSATFSPVPTVASGARVVGIAEVVREAYPDPDPEQTGDWVQIDLRAVEPLKAPVTLKAIKATPQLAALPLIKQSRLSCMPITASHFEKLVKMGSVK